MHWVLSATPGRGRWRGTCNQSPPPSPTDNWPILQKLGQLPASAAEDRGPSESPLLPRTDRGHPWAAGIDPAPTQGAGPTLPCGPATQSLHCLPVSGTH